jgi:hypothetical protein
MTNEQVAKWVGWTAKATTKPSFADPSKTVDGGNAWFHKDLGTARRLPDYSQDGPHWQAVYREIERRGLCVAYRWHLQQAVSDRAEAHWHGGEWAKLTEWLAYALATATPAERLAAPGKVMEEEKANA